MTDDLHPVKAYFAGHIIFLAKEAYKRTQGNDSDQAPGKSDAIVSIVFSACALEAFINELTDRASTENPEHYTHPDIVKTFASIMSELEESKSSIRLKFLMTSIIFSGKPYDTSSQLYQNFSLLFRIRDALVHLRPQDEYATTLTNEFVRINTPKVLSGLPKNIQAKYGSDNTIASWIGVISTRAVAKWACNASSSMVISVLDMLPDCQFRKMAESYRRPFAIL